MHTCRLLEQSEEATANCTSIELLLFQLNAWGMSHVWHVVSHEPFKLSHNAQRTIRCAMAMVSTRLGFDVRHPTHKFMLIYSTELWNRRTNQSTNRQSVCLLCNFRINCVSTGHHCVLCAVENHTNVRCDERLQF